jgi:hypothetical protein
MTSCPHCGGPVTPVEEYEHNGEHYLVLECRECDSAVVVVDPATT